MNARGACCLGMLPNLSRAPAAAQTVRTSSPQKPASVPLPNCSPDCKALKAMYEAGHEVAVHTVSHKRLAGEAQDFVESQVLDGRRQLADCGIPERDIVGFRAPFLSVDPQLRRVLHDGSFAYDRWGAVHLCVPAARSLPVVAAGSLHSQPA